MAAPTVPGGTSGGAGAPATRKPRGPGVGQRIALWWRKNTQNLDLFDENGRDKVKTDPWVMVGGAAMLFWLITIVTGTLLMFFYVPTVYQAYRSVDVIKQDLPLMAFIRNMHKYGADALIITLTMRVYRMYFRGEYKNNNQLSYMVTIIGLILAMFSGLSGYLLIWNQRALWATKVFATFPTFIDNLDEIPTIANIPILANTVGVALKSTLGQLHIGHTMATYLLSGAAIGPATLTRFYSFHFMLSFFSLIAVEAYFYRKGSAGRVQRINLPWYSLLAFVGMLAAVSLLVPVDLGSPANYNVTPNPILSDWYFLGLYQMMKLWKPTTATLLTILIPVFAFLPAFVDFSPERSMWKRPFWTVLALWGFAMWIVFSVLICLEIADIKRDPPIVYAFSGVVLAAGAAWHWSYRLRERRLARAAEAAKLAVQGAAPMPPAAKGA